MMARALRLAASGLYTTDPNPRVGCVVVRDGRVVGEGWHVRAGEAHAEVLALAAAGDQARGADVYLTLEPCCHQGRTPPCTEALIEADVARVFCAMRDPNPAVAGKGFAALEAAGLEVIMMDRAGAEARQLNPGFIKRMATGRPWIRVKVAMSLDGRTALSSGESRWITGDAARRDVHRWRARASCILTGSGTVLADDPALSVRLNDPEVAVSAPAIALVDTSLSILASSRLFDLHERVLVFCAGPDPQAVKKLEQRGAEVIEVAGTAAGRVDLPAVFRELGRLEINEVHVEAGATLCGALIDSEMIDELLIYMAPSLLGDSARGAFSMTPLSSLEDRTQLYIQQIRPIGNDLRIRALPIIDRE